MYTTTQYATMMTVSASGIAPTINGRHKTLNSGTYQHAASSA
jgi:hypothetical protein